MKKDDQISYSILSEMYSKWTQFDIPVTFYHYFLTILKTKSKQEQSLLMQREITSIKSGTHLYLKIKSSIQARQNSLSIIQHNLHLFNNQEILSKPLNNNIEEREILGYKKLFQSKEFRIEQRTQNRSFRQLANHLILYRKITLQIVFLIHKWMVEIMCQGYLGQMQFIYKNQDYLQRITQGTLAILQQYHHIFQFNPFFMLKKDLANGKYALIYQFLKISPDYCNNLYQALKLLAEHHNNLLKQKLLKYHSFVPNKKKFVKSNSVGKIYGNLLNGRQYYMVKDSYLKSDKLLAKQSSTVQTLSKNKSQFRDSNKIGSSPHKIYKGLQSPPLLVNPQKVPKTNFIQRKYPTFFSDNTQNQANQRRTNQLTNYLLQRKISTGLESIKHKNSVIIKNYIEPDLSRKINNGLEDEYKLKLLHELDRQRNFINNKDRQREQKIKLERYNQIMQNHYNQQSLLTTQSRLEKLQISQIKNLQRSQRKVQQSQSYVQTKDNLDKLLQKSFQQINQNHIEFKVQKNLAPTNLIRYLRGIFKQKPIINNQNNHNPINYDQQSIEKLAKMLLNHRKVITIYKIISNEHNNESKLQINKQRTRNRSQNLIAWIVCKLSKDYSTLQKTVDLLYFYQFRKGFDLQKILIQYFKSIGYFNLKQNGNIVSRIQQANRQQTGVQVIRSKYKVSPFALPEDIKQIVKNNTALKMNRILKYHYYNKISKYHKFCQHKSKQGTCSIGYYFDNVQKIFLNNRPHIKVKVDSISRKKQCYKIYHHLNNKTFLILATTIQDLKNYESDLQNQYKKQCDRDSSFQNQNQKNITNEYNYLCFQEVKLMHKYVNDKQKTVINQFLWIQNNVHQIRSIAVQKNEIIGSDVLVISQPYILAIYAQYTNEGYKSLAALDFSQ